MLIYCAFSLKFTKCSLFKKTLSMKNDKIWKQIFMSKQIKWNPFDSVLLEVADCSTNIFPKVSMKLQRPSAKAVCTHLVSF